MGILKKCCVGYYESQAAWDSHDATKFHKQMIDAESSIDAWDLVQASLPPGYVVTSSTDDEERFNDLS